MEDLREVGQKAIESVNKLKASDAGDLVLGIGEIIQELREEPELRLKYPIKYQNKLDHLEGLFREFAYGEGYELRNNRVDVLEAEENTFNPTPWTLGGAASGLIMTQPITLSGVLPTGSFSLGSSSVAGIPPVMPPLAPTPDEDDVILEEEKKVEDDPFSEEELAQFREGQKALMPAEPKPFKPKWWQSKA